MAACFAVSTKLKSPTKSRTRITMRSSEGPCTPSTRAGCPSIVAVKTPGPDAPSATPASAHTGTRMWRAPSLGGAAQSRGTMQREYRIGRISETERQAELDHSTAPRADDLAGVHVGGGFGADDDIGIIPVGVIQEIQTYGAELDTAVGGQGETLGKRKVLILGNWAAQRRIRARSVAGSEVLRLLESRRVEPLFGAGVGNLRGHAGNHVHAQRGNHAPRVVELRAKGERTPGVQSRNEAERPPIH